MMFGVICCVIASILFFGGYASRGVVRCLDDLETAIEQLLKRGYNCGYLVIKVSYTCKFVQLRKYITGPGDFGVQLAFPKARWSRAYFDHVEKICRSIDSAMCWVGDVEGMEFLYMDFGKDSKKASRCVAEILAKVFGVSSTTKLFVSLNHSAIWDELIDTPDKCSSEPLKETLKRAKKLIINARKMPRKNLRKQNEKKPS